MVVGKNMRTETLRVLIAIVIALVFATGAPFWWKYLFGDHGSGTPSSTPSSAATTPGTSVVGFTGGCEPFRVNAQNRWQPYGARKLRAPNPLAEKIGSFAPNEVVAVDGWVHAVIAHPTNRPPWNSDIWYHLADGTGWVSFAAVRAVPTVQDPTGLAADGGPPAATPPSCEGAIH